MLTVPIIGLWSLSPSHFDKIIQFARSVKVVVVRMSVILLPKASALFDPAALTMNSPR